MGASFRRIEDFAHREFRVVLAQSDRRFAGIAWNPRGQEVLRESDTCLDSLKAAIKARLEELSQQFVGFEEGIELFRRAFPDGFACDYYKYRERDYKEHTATLIREGLSPSRIDQALATGRSEPILAAARDALASSNLCHPKFEQPLIFNALKTPAMVGHFPGILRELLYGDFDRGLERLAAHLRPLDAAKWPILTFWAFFRHPDRHMFLKPEVTKTCADRLGFEFDYRPPPAVETYRSVLGFAGFVRTGIAVLAPADNIDVQSFIHVVGSDDYVRRAVPEREEVERKRRDG